MNKRSAAYRDARDVARNILDNQKYNNAIEMIYDLIKQTEAKGDRKYKKLHAAAFDVDTTLAKLIKAEQVDLVCTDIGAQAIKDRLQKLHKILNGDRHENSPAIRNKNTATVA